MEVLVSDLNGIMRLSVLPCLHLSKSNHVRRVCSINLKASIFISTFFLFRKTVELGFDFFPCCRNILEYPCYTNNSLISGGINSIGELGTSQKGRSKTILPNSQHAWTRPTTTPDFRAGKQSTILWTPFHYQGKRK